MGKNKIVIKENSNLLVSLRFKGSVHEMAGLLIFALAQLINNNRQPNVSNETLSNDVSKDLLNKLNTINPTSKKDKEFENLD